MYDSNIHNSIFKQIHNNCEMIVSRMLFNIHAYIYFKKDLTGHLQCYAS